MDAVSDVSKPIGFTVRGPITRADFAGLCDRVCAVLGDKHGLTIDCDVSTVAPDGVAVDALARLQVAAQRNGCRVRLRQASPQLLQLVAWMGLADVLDS